MKLTIMTFNIQHGKDYVKQVIDLSLMAETIRGAEAEIISLNEVYEGQEKELGDLLGFHSYFARAIELKGRWFGNALLSKYPFLETNTIPIPDPITKDEPAYYETRCLLRATFKDFPLTVFSSHFGLAKQEARNAVQTILENVTKEKTVLMGDFNLIPTDDIIEPIMELFLEVSQKGKNSKSLLNWKKSFPSIDPNRRIDYIFTSSDIEVISGDVYEVVASDHFPELAIIELK